MVTQVWVHEQGDGRLDIVDGKQRITSLLSYLGGIFPRTQQRFALEAHQRPEIILMLADFLGHVHLHTTRSCSMLHRGCVMRSRW